MKAGFSEFSYGFAFTYGLLNDLIGIESAPTFPSLREESNVGYDVGLDFPGLPLYFQYKLSDILIRSNASYWQDYRRSYFRIEITPRKRSLQHNILKQLSESGEPDVYYAAPKFATIDEFNVAFRSNQVATRSVWIPLTELPYLQDDDPHCITFDGVTSPWWHTTEGHRLDGDFSGEHFVADISERFRLRDIRQIDRDYVEGLRTKLLFSIEEQGMGSPTNFPRDFDQVSEGLRDVRFLLTTYFNLELLILRSATTPST